MLRAEPAEFVLFVPLTCDILGYISRKGPFFLHFLPFTNIYGTTGATMFLGPWPTLVMHPLDTPLCRAERARKLNEREKIRWSGSKAERSGRSGADGADGAERERSGAGAGAEG